MTPDFSPEDGALFDLSKRAKLRVTGADRLRFLNGQISNDIRKAQRDAAVHACVLNAKGKVNADVMIVAHDESFLLDTEAEARELLAARLERYIIADDVQIEDVTDEFALLHITGPAQHGNVTPIVSAHADRFGCAGTDLWISQSDSDVARQELAALLPTCDEQRAEVFRIERGVPRWGHELTDEIIPVEANLEANAIDYAKGCYIGQEVISRMKMSGQTNKRLCGLLPVSEAPVTPGMRLTNSDRHDVGWITSVAHSERLGRSIALGFVKRGSQTVGTQLDARSSAGTPEASSRVEVASLPFV